MVVLLAVPLLHADPLDDLAHDFWTWRAVEQPASFDDIPRLERPPGWLPDWSPAAVAGYRRQLEAFEARWKKMDPSAWPVTRQVDYRLMGSALARVHWELDLRRNWQRDPEFYVQQTVGAYADLLLQPPPFDAVRSRNIVATLASIPQILNDGKKNLTQPAAPFARVASEELKQVRSEMSNSVRALKPWLDPEAARDLDSAAERAIAALESFRDDLSRRLPTMSEETAVGRDAYVFFLKNVALMPFTPEQLLAMGRQEWARAVASQTYEEHRNLNAPPLKMFSDQAGEIAAEQRDEQGIRRYLEAKGLLSVPAWVQHYRYAPMPAYLTWVSGLTEADDFTGPSRLNQGATRYIYPPSDQLGYFHRTMARDPRGLIVHEGIPGHYFQLALSWANPDPIRRHYYDSGANEGIGFYAEEMLLHAGLFDDSPHTREFIWNFMRLRALRVEVDVKLALGQFTVSEAAEYLQSAVPMDAATAGTEAVNFASTPGLAIAYQVGKQQIEELLADARRKQGGAFSLRSLHDFVWQNGNVPIALQRWEYLGAKDAVEALERLR
jgi:uncharacterized protein (DUF885 family)